ncbi:MAG: hypothetical protein ABIO70_22430 [Pseudomonadota bacterium]
MRCPTCGLLNPPNAQRCDCGYDFAAGERRDSYLCATQGPGERAPKWLLTVGWVFCALGGLIGLLIAVHILNAKANTSSANRGRRYDEHSRGQAKMMAALGVLMILLGLFLRVVVMVGSVAG